MEPFDAVVLAGGAGQRLGGADKAAVTVGGATLLQRALDAVAEAERIVAVGPQRPTDARVRWTREDPPLGGPAAAVAAGLSLVRAGVTVVLAVDMPFAASAVPRLLAGLPADADGAILVDAADHRQPLLAAYRTEALRLAVDAHRPVNGLAMRRLVAHLDLRPVAAVGPEAADCDTAEQVQDAEMEAHRATR
jgi:molybdopterin-guanine dinucleotide biosynthesis protein A